MLWPPRPGEADAQALPVRLSGKPGCPKLLVGGVRGKIRNAGGNAVFLDAKQPRQAGEQRVDSVRWNFAPRAMAARHSRNVPKQRQKLRAAAQNHLLAALRGKGNKAAKL